MSYVGDFLSGLVLSATRQPKTLAVDFALSGGGSVLVALAGWWQSDWSPGCGVLVLTGELARDQFGIAVGPDAHLLAPSSPEEILAVRNGRDSIRLDSVDYLLQLAALRDVSSPEWLPQLDEWIDAVRALPAWSAPQPPAETMEHRRVGFVPLIGETTEQCDVLVLDDHGAYAVARGNEWLESIGSQWASFSDDERPDLVSFLGWVADQTPYGSATLGVVEVGSGEGKTEGIALRSVPSIV